MGCGSSSRPVAAVPASKSAATVSPPEAQQDPQETTVGCESSSRSDPAALASKSPVSLPESQQESQGTTPLGSPSTKSHDTMATSVPEMEPAPFRKISPPAFEEATHTDATAPLSGEAMDGPRAFQSEKHWHATWQPSSGLPADRHESYSSLDKLLPGENRFAEEWRDHAHYIGLSVAALSFGQMLLFCAAALAGVFTCTCTGGASLAIYFFVGVGVALVRYGESMLHLRVSSLDDNNGPMDWRTWRSLAWTSQARPKDFWQYGYLLMGACCACNCFTDMQFLAQAHACAGQVESAWSARSADFPSVGVNVPVWDIIDRTSLWFYREEFLFFEATFSRSMAFFIATVIAPQVIGQLACASWVIWQARRAAACRPIYLHIRWLAGQAGFLSLGAAFEANGLPGRIDSLEPTGSTAAAFLLPVALRWAYQECWYGLLVQPHFLRFVWPRLSWAAAMQSLFSIILSFVESLRELVTIAIMVRRLMKEDNLRFSLRIALMSCIAASVLHSFLLLLLSALCYAYIVFRPAQNAILQGMTWFILIGALIQAFTGYVYFLPTLVSALSCELRSDGAVACPGS